jgi:prepilin-type N-terminal cleavage/methylation domain-containing protein
MRGFSMVEMLIVMCVLLVLVAITFISYQTAMKSVRTSNAFNQVLQQIRSARQSAIEKREQYIVCFGAGSAPTGAAHPYGAPDAQSIQIYEWPYGAALSTAIQISSVELPSDIQFQSLSGLPTATPDGFGSTAINFDQGVAGGVNNQIMFMPDGSARDTNGNFNSGIIYLGRTGDLTSARAITLFGASGATRGWRISHPGGAASWVVQ